MGGGVGKTGFEPATPWSQTRCATGLRYFPPSLKLRRVLPAEALVKYYNFAESLAVIDRRSFSESGEGGIRTLGTV